MATISASWTENQSLTFSDASPADNVQSTVDIDLAAAGYDAVQVQVQIDWNAAATDYADINIYSSPDSGTTDDTTVIYNRRVDALTNDPENISFVIRDLAYITIEVDNQSNQEITGLTGDYAGRQWTSA